MVDAVEVCESQHCVRKSRRTWVEEERKPAGNYTIIADSIGCVYDARAKRTVIASCGGFVEHN